MRSLGPAWPQTLYGNLALDFANTLDWRTRQQPEETVRDYRDLLRFALATRALTRVDAAHLLSWGARDREGARRALSRALLLREAVAAIFQAVSRRRAVPSDALATLERAWRAARGARELRPERGSASWRWRSRAPEPDRPAWSVALEAERLLTGPGAPISECQGEGCGWLFLDTSRNQSRRWCSMQSCGNRAKARRFYQRSRSDRKRGARRSRSD